MQFKWVGIALECQEKSGIEGLNICIYASKILCFELSKMYSFL